MTRLSLNVRILVGALFWTAGLFALAGLFHELTHDGLMPHGHHMRSLPWRPGAPATAVVGLAAMVLGFVLVRRGLSPIARLRSRLSAVHAGRDARVYGAYPSEVQPLVDDLNALLADRERRVVRAGAKAADLAHGLKTPLAVLAHEAQQARVAGHAALAAAIDQQIERMRRQVDAHLAQTRSAASSGSLAARTLVGESVAGLTRTLQRLHDGRSLRFDLQVPPALAFRGARADLDEMLGSLLDNACTWARGRVSVAGLADGDRIVITIDDDGPGIEPGLREAVLQRGVRADEAAPGHGLGLAIVRDIAEEYGGTVALEGSPLGGTRARLTLPAAAGAG